MTRALMAAVACCLMLALAGPAAAASFDQGSPEFAKALEVSQQLWGGMPCGGQVTFGWRDEDPAVNATSYWSSGFTNCEIVFNRAAGMGYAKFCTVLTHELGHLHGRGHSSDPDDLMSAIYTSALPACGGGAAPASDAAEDPLEEEEEATDAEALRGVRMTKREAARIRAARRCNRKQSRRAVRLCKRTLARRMTVRRRNIARSVTTLTPGAILSAPLA